MMAGIEVNCILASVHSNFPILRWIFVSLYLSFLYTLFIARVSVAVIKYHMQKHSWRNGLFHLTDYVWTLTEVMAKNSGLL